MTEINGIQKKKKPSFIRHDAHKKPRVGTGWRKPKGRQNKMRLGWKGYRRAISIGFGSDKRIRDMVKEGLIPVRIHNQEELKNLDKEKQGALIAKQVGQKNKLELVKKAKELNITVLNVKNTEDYIKKTEEKFIKKKEEKKETEKEKEEKRKELEKKSKTIKKEEKTTEEKAAEEKKAKEEVMKKGL